MAHPPRHRTLFPILSGMLIVLTCLWGAILAKQKRVRRTAKLSTAELSKLASDAATHTGVDKALILAVIRVESAGRAGAVSPVGAKGLMQLMPATARDMLRQEKLPLTTDWTDPAVNVKLGARYLKNMHVMFHNDLDKVLAAYNGGPGNVRKWIRRAKARHEPEKWLKYAYKETRLYVPKVKKYFRRYKKQ